MTESGRRETFREAGKGETRAKVVVSRRLKEVHPIVNKIVNNLAELGPIKLIRVSPDFLQASSEVTEGRTKTPITKVGHPSAVGVSLILDCPHKNVQFFEITSATKGHGGKMVDAVLTALPADWEGVVVMDWSGGFWDEMAKRHRNLAIL